MKEFHAKLRPPKRELWLGCKIASLEGRRSNITGRGYYLVRFENCPYLATWHHKSQEWLHQVLADRGVEFSPANDIRVGDEILIDVRYEADPNSNPANPTIYPRVMIDIPSVADNVRPIRTA